MCNFDSFLALCFVNIGLLLFYINGNSLILFFERLLSLIRVLKTYGKIDDLLMYNIKKNITIFLYHNNQFHSHRSQIINL